jgi:hypothetical protein
MSQAMSSVTLEQDRMDDDGGPPLYVPHPVQRSRSKHVSEVSQHDIGTQDGRPAGVTNDRYRRLGANHRRRDEIARQAARTIQDSDTRRQLACRTRWPEIVAAMRALITAYNQGTRLESLVLVDGPSGDAGELSVRVTAQSGQTLTMALDGDDLWVRPMRDDSGTLTQSERWIGLGRTNEATAEYVLQHWLTQL